MNSKLCYSIFLTVLVIILSSCSIDRFEFGSESSTGKWLYENIVGLDPVDAPTPESDLIAAYTRTTGNMFEIRLDYLETSSVNKYTTTILIKSDPGTQYFDDVESIQWDYQIEIDDQPDSQLIDISSGRVVLDLETSIFPDLDYLVVSIPIDKLHSNQQNALLFCLVSDPNNHEILDQFGPFSLLEKAETAWSPLLITLWDVYESNTPAQALRSWNGAHSGPFGSRHGLYYLLNSIKKYQVPVVLVDLKEPTNLQVLNYMKSLDIIRNMVADGLLILPDTAYGFNADRGLSINREISKSFRIPDSQFLYGNINWGDIPFATTGFAVVNNTNEVQISENRVRVIPLPSSYMDNSTPFTNQTNLSGSFEFPLYLKEELIKVALSDNPFDFVNLGESFTKSALGDPSISDSFFAYIDSHPWIKAVSQGDLENFHYAEIAHIQAEECMDLLCSPPLPDAQVQTVYGTTNPDALNYIDMADQLNNVLENLANNEISASAWLMYQKFMDPANSDFDHQLQSNYLGQIGHLAQASAWLDSPVTIHKCFDLDWDGIPECILSNEKVFSSYEIEGGRLLYLYIINDCGIIPVINPFSQYVVGLTDPDQWDINKGYLSDPNEISGFLADGMDQYGNYTVEISNNTIEFQDKRSQIIKIFTLAKDKLNIMATYPIQTEAAIPLVPHLVASTESVDKVQLVKNNNFRAFGFQESSTETGKACLAIEIPGNDLHITSYKDSTALLDSPENPDQSYPPGHYLPFPFQTIQFIINKTQIINIISLD